MGSDSEEILVSIKIGPILYIISHIARCEINDENANEIGRRRF